MVPKNIVLKLVSISYSGKSIGNDIRIEIKALHHVFNTDITLDLGKTVQLNKRIGIFAANQDSFDLPLKITIVEKDPMYDDIMSGTIHLKVNLDSKTKQSSTHQLHVKETRKWSKGKEAIFEITFEMIVQDAIRYIEEMDDGFLVVIIDKMKDKQSLPAFLKVQFRRREAGRDYFTILEGKYNGKNGSVETKNDLDSYLLSENFYTGPIHVVYSKSKKTLVLNRKTYETIDDPREPWKKGTYDIEIADAPHKAGLRYVHIAPKAKVWFHIGHDPKEEKYIHTGQQTLGCITLVEHKKWDEVYNILIRARKGDSKSVGTLEITD